MNFEALKHVLVEFNSFLKEMNFTHKVWKSFVVSFFVSCYLVGNQHQEVVIFLEKQERQRSVRVRAQNPAEMLPWWSDWNESFLLWLVMASSQEMWSSLTLDTEAAEASSWPHPSIFISLLYTGRVHTGNPLFKTAVVYVDFLLLDFSCCTQLLKGRSSFTKKYCITGTTY